MCGRCGTENTAHVFKSVSQVAVRLTDTLRLTGCQVAQGPVWQVELGERPSVFVM